MVMINDKSIEMIR